MQRLLALLLTAVLAVGLYAATAGGGQQTVTPGQFAALSKKVTKIRKDLDATTGVLASCVMGTAIPINQYNDYVGVDANGQEFKTTGLDLTGPGGTPNGFALLVNPDPACVALINGSSLRNLAAFAPLLHARARPNFAHQRSHR
jgi:hypothetical protein